MKHVAKRLACFLLLFIVVGSNGSAQPSQHAKRTLDEKFLRENVNHLASPKLEGRRTGTPGADQAGLYIAETFSRYGLKPAGKNNKKDNSLNHYMQAFPFIAGVELGQQNKMAYTKNNETINLKLKEDWMPVGWSTNGKVEESAVAFIGYGIKAAEQGHNDYSNIDVRGRIVVALSGAPDGPHGRLSSYAALRLKAASAREYGAAALIVIAQDDNFADDRLSRLRYDHNAGEAGLPVVAISKQAAKRLFDIDNKLVADNEIWKGDLITIKHSASTQQHPSFLIPNVLLSLQTDVVHRRAPAANVIGILEGSDSTLKNEALVIGAHYDHLGHGGIESLSPKDDAIHYGADDNASGTSGMLELARIFSRKENRPRRTLIFIAFSGEEQGLIGSNYYVNHPVFPLSNTVGMINLDMIGRLRDNRLTIDGVGTAKEWPTILANANLSNEIQVTLSQTTSHPTSSSHLPVVTGANGETIAAINTKKFSLTLNQSGFGPSDHASFSTKQVPVLAFWTGLHEDYHRPTDTADKVNYSGIARIVAFVQDILQQVDMSKQRLTYTEVKDDSRGRSASFRVYLGTVPSYADSSNGLKLDFVKDGSPAAKAGLKAGDRIVKLSGREIRNVYDYTFALSEMKAGEEYEVEIVRGNENLKLKVIPALRQ
jgi:aminopeptidase YwaD